MLLEILKFELKYRIQRPATYIYFFIAMIFAFLSISTDMVTIGSSSGKVMENAPIKVAEMMTIMSAFLMMVTSAIMGVPVLRDFEHKTESLIFVNPIKKIDYLAGRFLGSFIILLIIYVGMLIGFLLSDFAPWRDAANLSPHNSWIFIQPFLILVLPNVFFSAAVFFAGGTLSRKNLVVYTQGIFLLILFLFASELTSNLSNKTIAMLADPFGINTIQIFSEYWTIAEQNTLLVPLQGAVLGNRLLWIGVGIIAFIITYFGFSFNVVRKSIFKKKHNNNNINNSNIKIDIPKINIQFGILTDIKQLFKLGFFYCKSLFKEIPFLAITFFGLMLLVINSQNLDNMMGVHAYPTTYRILSVISNSFEIFYILIIIYFSGELIWKERDLKFNQITDATPLKDFTKLASKFLGLIFAILIIQFLLMLIGLSIQTLSSYYNYNIHLYIFELFVDRLMYVVLFTLAIFFIQILVNNKYLGFGVSIIFFVFAFMVIDNIGLEHRLFQFSRNGLGIYSDMNQYGHYLQSFNWFNVYWFGFASSLFLLAVIFSVRGTDSLMKTRLKMSKYRLTRSLMIFGILTILTFVLSGCYIFYNTNVINEYINSNQEEDLSFNYEKDLKQYQYLPQPKIVDVNLNVDIFPKTRDFSAEGYFYLKNKTKNPIADIHIQQKPDKQLVVEYLKFDRKSIIKESYDNYRYFIYNLEQKLQPGDSIKMSFKIVYNTKGFVEGGSNTDILNNGTFFNNLYFPTLGYNDGYELSDEKKRKEYKLPEKERMLNRDDPQGQAMSLIGDDADNIFFEIIMSTSEDQIAIAPGYLQKDWIENNRHYFHYKMDVPMFNFYSMVSARYVVAHDKWNDVNLDVYYHKQHNYNIDIMIDAMKKSLDYYTVNFGPYQFRQMRIMEFPRYSSFAQSFANTVPFSEGIGFIMKIEDDDPNVPFFVTAHEFAHQWWGHQVSEANVKGNAMISEGLAQYSAYMVIKHNFSQKILKGFLKYDLNKYLRGRSQELKKELPLEFVEQQDYIHYNKGALAMFLFQDYISEDSVNSALRSFLKKWQYSEGIYPTTKDLIAEYKKVTPDTLQYLINDLFQTITLFENKTEKVVANKITENKYEVIIDVKSQKLRADSLGNENEIAINDWIYIGIYGKDIDNEENLIYYKRHKIDESEKTFKIFVDKKPTKAGIDPMIMLIDRHPKDNVKEINMDA